MRFKSQKIGSYQVFAVTGIDTVSFGIAADIGAARGLLGFAVEREDPVKNERYFMYGFKVFREVHPEPAPNLRVLTFDQPVQSFVWDDFTARPGQRFIYRFYPLAGRPKNLDRSAPAIPITVETEPLTAGAHDVFFNRGVASSQAYAREFKNQKPDKIADPVLRKRAFDWLSRRLDEKLFEFIDAAQSGDTLLGAFYEFRYRPAADRLKAAVDRGVTVKLVLDGKENGFTDNEVKVHAAFPLEDNKQMVAAAGLPAAAIVWRKKSPDAIAHNKFLVLLQGAAQTPSAVWTGSTNLSDGGIHGQTNVGHWVRDANVAAAFRDYWTVLEKDLGKKAGGTRAENTAAMKANREAVEALAAVPTDWKTIPQGTTPVFSPRSGGAVLDMYAAMLDESAGAGCITLAFGISEVFKSRLLDNPGAGPLLFLLLEKRDEPRANSTKPFRPLGARQNIYAAWGSYLNEPLYRWTRETNARRLDLNTHVSYIHSKFLLKDPLSDDPIVVTGSANFSQPSTNDNDENMLLIRGDQRAADIYFTEFNRLFFHYYFRSVQEAVHGRPPGSTPTGSTAAGGGDLFLDPTDSWLQKYTPGTFRAKRVAMFAAMKGTATL